MKKVLITIMVIIVLLLISGMVHTAIAQAQARASINTKTLGFNNSLSAFDVLVNITVTKLGHMVYVEEYSTVDSDGQPKPATSGRYFDSNITENNITFQILRPPSRGGKFYSLIKGVVILDGKRIRERWLKIPSGFDPNNVKPTDYGTNIDEGLIKREIIYKSLIANVTTTYKFTIHELSIYEANVTGIWNETDVTMRIKLYSSAPNTARPLSPGAIYKYLGVWIDTHQINNTTIKYRVENSWINNSNVTNKDVRSFKWNSTDKKWYGLRTNITGTDSNYTYFESNVANPSILVIAGISFKKVVSTNKTLKPTPTVVPTEIVIIETPEPTDTPEPETTNDIPGFGTIITITILSVVYILKKMNERFK